MASVGHVGHIELRDLDDDDLDAIFEMMRDRAAVEMAAFTAADPNDRDAFDAWIARERAAPEVATMSSPRTAASPARPRCSRSKAIAR